MNPTPSPGVGRLQTDGPTGPEGVRLHAATQPSRINPTPRTARIMAPAAALPRESSWGRDHNAAGTAITAVSSAAGRTLQMRATSQVRRGPPETAGGPEDPAIP